MKTLKTSIGYLFYYIAFFCSSILKGFRTFFDDVCEIDNILIGGLIKIISFLIIALPVGWVLVIYIITSFSLDYLFEEKERPDRSSFIF